MLLDTSFVRPPSHSMSKEDYETSKMQRPSDSDDGVGV